MSTITSIEAELRRLLTGPSWHGPSIRDILADVTAEEATAQSIPGVPSIWQTVLHMTAWSQEVAHRLKGGKAGDPENGDWPEITDMDDSQWALAQSDLTIAVGEVLNAVDEFPEECLSDLVERDLERQTGITFELMLRGLALHIAWHGGQIAIMKKGLRAED